jgi:hypothetical protein
MIGGAVASIHEAHCVPSQTRARRVARRATATAVEAGLPRDVRPIGGRAACTFSDAADTAASTAAGLYPVAIPAQRSAFTKS